MINMKRLLSIIGLLTIVIPSSLSVVACSSTQDKENDNNNVISNIEKISNLKLDINALELKQTAITVLDNKDYGVGAKLAKHPSLINKFKKELFKLDTNNIYTDAKGINKVSKEQIIEFTTYYFKFIYDGQKNNILVPVKIDSTEKIIVDSIQAKETQYTVGAKVNDEAQQIKKVIDVTFIKSKLKNEIRINFTDSKLKILKITNEENNELSNKDLKIRGEIKGHIIFDYGSFKNQEANLTITVKINDQPIVDAINSITDYEKEVFVHTKANDLIKIINGEFIKDKITDEILKKDFNIYSFSVNKITLNDKKITDENLNDEGMLETKVNYNYDTVKEQTITLKIKRTIGAISKEEFIRIANERNTNNPIKFTIKVISSSEDYLPEVINKMEEQTYNEFLTIYKYKIDIKKLSIEDVSNDAMNPKRISYKWFLKKATIAAIGRIIYDDLLTKQINFVFNVVENN